MTSEVDGSVHFPPMKSLSYSVSMSLIFRRSSSSLRSASSPAGMAPPYPSQPQNENMFQSTNFSAFLRRFSAGLSWPEHQYQIAHQKLAQH
ncbi:MAG: hypothetical protein ABSD32_16500, partial [Mycobacterium sp.]